MTSFTLEGKTILITGGTGSFGQAAVAKLVQTNVRKIIVLSRDEYKQWEMARLYTKEDRVRFYLGDVRDARRVSLAFHGVDFVIHAAALKQVPALEENPFEAVQTNVIGARNVIEAALERGVKKVVALSTDKACGPVNLYGATKLVAEKLFLDADSYRGDWPTFFSVVRYGNVVNSRGSVLDLWKEQAKSGVLDITSTHMTRFWTTLDEAVRFVLRCLDETPGGEMWIPRLPAFRLVDLACVVAPHSTINIIGLRRGEKMAEELVSENESEHVFEEDDRFLLLKSTFSNTPWSYNSGDEPPMSREEIQKRLKCLQR